MMVNFKLSKVALSHACDMMITSILISLLSLKFTIIFYFIADPSSMQEACHT